MAHLGDARPLLLGSGSPRRKAMLASLGLPLLVRPVHVDESQRGEAPLAYLERVVTDKLEAVCALDATVGGRLVADTVVVADGVALGKPVDRDDARAMIERLAGRTHEVWTRFALADATGAPLGAETVRTRVTFRDLAASEIAAYAACGEGDDKAGAYGIQGVGAMLVEGIEGSYANVVGLPLSHVVVALRRHGMIDTCPLPGAITA